MVFTGGAIHVGNGTIIGRGIMGIENGKIVFIGSEHEIIYDREKYKTVNCEGRHLYPGFIAPNSQLGLVEISGVRATRDTEETGEFNPEIRSIIAYNTDSRVIPTVRSNGILLVQVAPVGGILHGRSSVVKLDGWNWEDAAYKTDNVMHMKWPAMYKQDAGSGYMKPDSAYIPNVEKIRTFFEEAKAYCAIKENPKKNLRFEAMRDFFAGDTKKIFIEADYAKELIGAVQFAKDFNLNIVIVGGYDAPKVSDILIENDIPVILINLHRLPAREDDEVTFPYQLPSILKKEGIEFGISVSGETDTYWNMRNLPFVAGTAASFGLSKEEALMAITLSNAKILGIDETTGSLEAGKDATFIVSEGDVLDMRSSKIIRAYIQGRPVNLSNWQYEQYLRYSDKYGIEVK
jgi:hypothetical protein